MPKTEDLSPTEQARAEEEYQAQLDAIRASDMPNYERPPEARVAPEGWQPPPKEVMLGWGLSDAEILKIMRGAAGATNSGLVEYDEDAEAEKLEKLRMQRHQIAIIDNGQGVQSQLSGMERYFTGLDARGDGKKCKRVRYMSPRDEVVGINGYIFRIPKYKEVLIPTEVVEMLRKSGQALGNLDMVSAAFQARSREPIDMHEGDPYSFQAQAASQFPVSVGYRPE
jgi:hypothetical protein